MQTRVGGLWVINHFLLHERQTSIYLFQVTGYYPCGIPYGDNALTLDACTEDRFSITALEWTCELFLVRKSPKNTIQLNVGDVKNENQMK